MLRLQLNLRHRDGSTQASRLRIKRWAVRRRHAQFQVVSTRNAAVLSRDINRDESRRVRGEASEVGTLSGEDLPNDATINAPSTSMVTTAAWTGLEPSPGLRKDQARLWARHCARYRSPDNRRAIKQIVDTILPLILLVAAMFWTLHVAYWLTLLLAFPAGGLLVRAFIIQHDCGHGSFLTSPRMNAAVGRAMSLLTLAPYSLWRREHALHHNSSGNLERRGVGDIDTKTVAEYLASPPLERLRYRLYRHPLFLFGFGVPFYFLVLQRLPWFHGLKPAQSWRSVMTLNVGIAATYGMLGWLLGYAAVAMVVLPMLHVASAIGGWLFFIQHQFDATEWFPPEEWDMQIAAVHGSSYYVLPKPLQWITGNIGLHHIHHLNSMVPNYRLQECLDAMPELAQVNRLTLLESFRCVRLTLWDEAQRRLVSYSEVAMRRGQSL